jgi:hypothetical protein
MDLFCPHCTRRVTVPDEKAGQVVNCPLCAKQFMTPSLAPVNPPAPKPSPAAVVTPTVPSFTVPPSSSPMAVPPTPAPSMPTPAPTPPVPPPPPGDYTRSHTLHLRGEWLPFVPPACMVLIFFLSFFSWESPDSRDMLLAMTDVSDRKALQELADRIRPEVPLSMWELSFSKSGKLMFLAYALLLLLCILLASASLVFEKQWIAMPPPLRPFILWKDLIVALFLSIGFMILTYEYLDALHNYRVSPIMTAMKIAFRLHFLAIVASLLMFWLHWRKLSNAPPPKCELRW